MDRLLGYLHHYYSGEDGSDHPADDEPARRLRPVEAPADLAGLLIVPARTRTLEREVVERGLVWVDLGGGYAELTGGLLRLFVAEIDVIADAEGDDLLRLFGHEPEHTLEAKRFGPSWSERRRQG
jgi:hypothetical protein